MDWFGASGYWLSRFLLERSIAAVYVIAFVVAAKQFPPCSANAACRRSRAS